MHGGLDVRVAALVALLVAGLGSAGCGTGATKAQGEPFAAAGALIPTECYERALPDGTANLKTPVDCAEPHRAEVYGVLEMATQWPSDVYAYTTGSDVDRRWRAWADRGCGRLLQELSGADPVAEEIGLEDGYVIPALNGGFAFALVSPDEWEAGAHETRCHLSSAGGPAADEWGSRLLTADRPAELGACTVVRDGDYAYVPCSEPHAYEDLLKVDVTGLVEPDFAREVDPTDVTEEQYAVLSDICDDTETLLVGVDRADLAVLAATVTPATWERQGRYWTYCGVVATDGSDVSGSALDKGDDAVLFTTPTEPPPAPPADT